MRPLDVGLCRRRDVLGRRAQAARRPGVLDRFRDPEDARPHDAAGRQPRADSRRRGRAGRRLRVDAAQGRGGPATWPAIRTCSSRPTAPSASWACRAAPRRVSSSSAASRSASARRPTSRSTSTCASRSSQPPGQDGSDPLVCDGEAFLLKPVLRVIDNLEVGAITGRVDPAVISAACPVDQSAPYPGNVYLFGPVPAGETTTPDDYDAQRRRW